MFANENYVARRSHYIIFLGRTFARAKSADSKRERRRLALLFLSLLIFLSLIQLQDVEEVPRLRQDRFVCEMAGLPLVFTPLAVFARCLLVIGFVFHEYKVYFAEKTDGVNGDWWHKMCFRCQTCKVALQPGNFKEHAGEIFCSKVRV